MNRYMRWVKEKWAASEVEELNSDKQYKDAIGYNLDGGPAHSVEYAQAKENNWYGIGFGITWFLTFIGCWIYCIATYGFLLGVGLGWLPAAIVAAIVGALWPVILAIVILGGIFLANR